MYNLTNEDLCVVAGGLTDDEIVDTAIFTLYTLEAMHEKAAQEAWETGFNAAILTGLCAFYSGASFSTGALTTALVGHAAYTFSYTHSKAWWWNQ